VKKEPISFQTVKEALALLGIDELGLTTADRALLSMIIEKFSGGPVGLGTAATALSEEEGTIEEIHEPYLIQLGLLERTPRGRRVTNKAYLHLGYDFPKDRQESLL
jgi:Holliday junction DNA helicase RuvB